jgi:moderate conductance mechanosensitive channel
VQTLQSLVSAIFRVGSWILAFLLIISELKPSYAATLFTSAGIVGFGLAFGAQSLIKDFVNGMFIIFENQYRVGDIVTINNVSGKVEGITMRTTIIRDLNGYVYHIPNGSITLTTNQTMDYGRIYLDIKVKLDTDIALLEKTINTAGKQVAEIPKFEHKISEPPAFERISSINSDGIVAKVLGKVSLSDQKQIKSEFLKHLKKEFDKAKIKM